MKMGIGLPNAVPGTSGRQLTEWASAADEAGFSTLGTIDRLVYQNYEPLTALAAAAVVTKRVRLATTILLGPLRANAALLAKQVLSIDALAGGGRTTLGIAVGGREDDYEVSGIPMSERGRWLDAALPIIRGIWNGDGELQSKVGPRMTGVGPSLVVGGSVDAAFERVAKHGDGWMMGGGSPEQFAGAVEKVHAAWEEHGSDGEPRTMALAYFALGDEAEAAAASYLREYYAYAGDETAGMIVSSAAKDAETVRGYLAAFAAAGCDELILFPCSNDPEQVELLAEAGGLG